MIINCYLEPITKERLEQASKDLGRTLEELAEAAISEAALNYWKSKQP